MRANGARLRRGVADDDMSAVEADPNDLIALFEYSVVLDVHGKTDVTLLVRLLDSRDLAEKLDRKSVV